MLDDPVDSEAEEAARRRELVATVLSEAGRSSPHAVQIIARALPRVYALKPAAEWRVVALEGVLRGVLPGR